MDALGFERHFIDHLVPVWAALPTSVRGRFLVDRSLIAHAQSLGIEATPIDGDGVRRKSPPPSAVIADGPPALVASIGDIKVGRRLGYRSFAFLEHGIAQSYFGAPGLAFGHPSYSGGEDREDVGLFMVPNEDAASRWRSRYPDARVEIVGCPKLDTLPGREFMSSGYEPVIAVSFHWEGRRLSPELTTAFHWYRTALPDLVKAYKVIGHGHPRWIADLSRHYSRVGIEVVEDFAEVCRRADVYVCDNSSTIYEFASTGRPVVVLNHPEYRRNVEHGLRFWAAADVGVQVNKPTELVAGVTEALRDPPERKVARESALSLVYGHRSGGADRAASAILDWLEERGEGRVYRPDVIGQAEGPAYWIPAEAEGVA